LDSFDLENLLNLNGEIYPLENGYWIKFEVYQADPSPQVPHGINYSLSLHDKYNRRVIGFDNAHGIKPKRKRFGARKITWDHKHQMEKVFEYEFESAGRLLEDFWSAIETFLGEGHA
jgi:hypothetical protein